MTNTDISGIISQELFAQYAANWNTVVSSDAELQHSFQDPAGGGKLAAVSFRMEQIQQLVSVVGARCIMARFLVTNDGARFTLALFATDAERQQRLSSFYIAGNAEPPVEPELPGEEVPDVLAEKWLQTWAEAPLVTRELFGSSVGDEPLKGYTFDITDFLVQFYDLPKIAGATLQVHFGLHEYYRPTKEGDKLTQTFGLVLRKSSSEGSSDPFYDMSSPCPPICWPL